jgi:hypothetical protein
MMTQGIHLDYYMIALTGYFESGYFFTVIQQPTSMLSNPTSMTYYTNFGSSNFEAGTYFIKAVKITSTLSFKVLLYSSNKIYICTVDMQGLTYNIQSTIPASNNHNYGKVIFIGESSYYLHYYGHSFYKNKQS